jgi:hypothetical protein
MHDAKNAADLASDSIFDSANLLGGWICYDFKEARVSVMNYSMRAAAHTSGGCNLRSWVLEGSTDGENWTELDRQEDSRALYSANAIGTWQIEATEFFRRIRVRSIGVNQQGTFNFFISGLELFGEML